MFGKNLLDVKLDSDNGAKAQNIRGYLTTLLATAWTHGEHFDPKAPFGTLEWEYDLYWGLAKAGLVSATFDSYGYIETVDKIAADELILQAINQLK